jgi:hypothetical protein
VDIIKGMKEYLLNQMQEKSGFTGNGKPNQTAANYLSLEQKLRKKEQIENYRKQLDYQAKTRTEVAYMTETEKKINKKLLDKINI